MEKWGPESRVMLAVEEMAELTKALIKCIRYGTKDEILYEIAEERADVQIMLNQLNVIFGDNSDWECEKLDRLAALIETEDTAEGQH